MAKSTTTSMGAAPQRPLLDTALLTKKRELFELRIRWKIADEATRKFAEERKDFKARIDMLAAEVLAAEGKGAPNDDAPNS